MSRSKNQHRHQLPPEPTAKALARAMDRPLRVISLGSLLEMDIPKREHLISPWLRQGESAMIYAPPGVGKSLFVLSLALAVASGGKMLGWKAPKARKVLFVDGEMPIDDIRDRAAMLLPSVIDDEDEEAKTAACQNMAFLARQYQNANADFPDLAEEGGRDALIKQAREQGAELVILDNLSTLATIDDENAASAFNAPVAFLLKMKQAGLACILVHHSGKSSGSYRGSSKIATTFEAILHLTPLINPLVSPDEAGSKTRFQLTWEKFRGKRDKNTGTDQDITLETMPNFGQTTVEERAVWSCEPAVSQKLERMLALLKSGECATQNELAAAMDCQQGTISKLRARAIVEGLITDKEWMNLMKTARNLRQQAEADFGEGEGEELPSSQADF